MSADGRQSQDPYVGGAIWPNMFPAQALQHPNWDQLYIPDFPAGLALNTSTPILNNDYAQASVVSGPLSSFEGLSSAGTPAPSESSLSPLFSTSSRLSSPSTPSSTYNRSFSSPASSKDLLLASADNQTPGAMDSQDTKVCVITFFFFLLICIFGLVFRPTRTSIHIGNNSSCSVRLSNCLGMALGRLFLSRCTSPTLPATENATLKRFYWRHHSFFIPTTLLGAASS